MTVTPLKWVLGHDHLSLVVVKLSSLKNYGLSSKAIKGRHSNHPSIKTDFGVITIRSHDTLRKLTKNSRKNNDLVEITTSLLLERSRAMILLLVA